MRRWLLVAFLGAGASGAHAQPVADSLRGVQTRFVRDVGRYRYEGRLGYAATVGPWRLHTHGRLVSDAFEGAAGDLSFRDEWEGQGSLWRGRAETGSVGVQVQASGFPQSQVYTHGAQAAYRRLGAEYAVEARGGLALEGRPGAPLGTVSAPVLRLDAGPAAGLTLALQGALGTYAYDLQTRIEGAVVGPRRSRDARAELHLALPDAPGRFEGRVRATSVRRDAYGAASFLNRTQTPAEAIEATMSDTLDAGLAFEAPLWGRLRWSVATEGGVVRRRVRLGKAPDGALVFDTDFRRQRIDAEGALAYAHGASEARVAVASGAAREDRLLVNAAALPVAEATQKADLLDQADFAQGDLGVSARLRTAWGRLTAALDARQSVARLDTPDLNPDDRDEARGAATLTLGWHATPTVTFGTDVAAADLQTVYLRRLRSAESQRRRSLSVRPFLDVNTLATRLRLTSEVRATYTRDRFRLPAREPADASAREWRTEADATHRIAPDLRLDVLLTASDLRLGRLAVDRFAEVPTDTIRTLGLRALLVRGTRSRVGFGVRLFERSDYDRSLTVRYVRDGAEGTFTRAGRSRLRQLGPLALVVVPVHAQSSVQLEGWVARQHTWIAYDGALPEAVAAPVRAAARTGTARMRPQVTLRADWRW